MAMIKCKMCGGDLEIIAENSVATCEYCGTQQTVPNADNEKKMTLFGRANRLRMACEFDKAAGVYESIVAEFPEEAEAYWGLVLCKYGIEYVDDPATGKKIPTCHRSSFECVMDDSNLEQALENADAVARRVYRDEAKAIEELRKGIIEISGKEEPYDIFICYKETDANGERTIDSVIAQDVYDALTEKGYRVFFSRITLEDKLGQEYEPYIFAALRSAKIMLAFGTDYEYYNAVWVKNEWSRFLQLIAAGEKKTLIPCYKGIDAYDMPKEFARLQAQDMGKVGAMQDLLRGIEKILSAGATGAVVVQQTQNSVTEPILKRAFMALEDREWAKADEFCEQVLNVDPENVQAYLCKLLAEKMVSNVQQLACGTPRKTLYWCNFEKSKNYQKLLRFADDELKETLAEALIKIKKLGENVAKHEAAREDFKKNAFVTDGVLKRYRGKESNIYIPESVTSIGERAFWGCIGIESVVIPRSVTSIGERAFWGCTALESVDIPNSVTIIAEGAFDECIALASITIPASVEKITGNPFVKCSGLKKIIVDKGNRKYCVVNGGLIEKDTKTLIATVSDGAIPDDESVTAIGERVFLGRTELTSITIPRSVKSIGNGAFAGCTTLSSIAIPKSVTAIGERAFNVCSALTSIAIPDSVTTIEIGAFYGCTALASITIPDSVTTIGAGAFCGCTALASITIPDSVTTIGEAAFKGCTALASITIPDSVTTIGAGAFCGCTALASITIPDSVTTIGEAAFKGCTALASITIPDSVTTIGEAAFKGCTALMSIKIPRRVTKMEGNPFADCAELREIIVAEDNKKYRLVNGHLLDTETKTLVCTISNEPIPDDGSVAAIGNDAFSGRATLVTITIPSSVNTIGKSAFCNCKSLTAITIPDSVSSIGEDTFRGCTELSAVAIGNSVTAIDENAFEETKKVRIITPLNSYADRWAKQKNIPVQEDEVSKQARLAAEKAKIEEEKRVAAERRAAALAAEKAKIEEEKRVAAERRAVGLCQHCGGEFKGLFSKKCSSCGKPKDY